MYSYGFTPFRFLGSRDKWLQFLSNVIMFVPIGLLSAEHGWKGTILTGVAFSIGIEAAQFLLKNGFSELDDVIANTAGTAVGYFTIKLGGKYRVYKRFLKRFLDICISTVALIAFSPLMAIVAIVIMLTSPGPTIFKQIRLGRGGKEFQILKFRSMVVGAEHTGSGVYSGTGDARVTKIGRIIRATSIDELPQLINILKGDMSLIGPRPPLTYHPWTIDKYTKDQLRMFEVRPGITGWAQVHGRKDVEWHERIRLNVWYVDHVSFTLDVKIFFMTIFKVLSNADNENKGETVKK